MESRTHTKTEKALALLAETFYDYARKGKDGDDNQLDREEMDLLLKKELVHFLGDGTFEQFDRDNSGSVTFVEFMRELGEIGTQAQMKVKQAICKQNV